MKKNLTLILTILILNLSLTASSFANSGKNAKHAEKVKANITKLGTGEDAKVKVKLQDGTKLKGFVSQINADSFVVVNEKTGASSEVPYQNAKQIKGNNLSTGAKIAIAVGIILAVTLVIGLIAFSP